MQLAQAHQEPPIIEGPTRLPLNEGMTKPPPIQAYCEARTQRRRQPNHARV
jgi:hypothetical protein